MTDLQSLTEASKLEALGRVLDASGFEDSGNRARLLSYVVIESIEGRAGQIKATTIAQDVFGRGAAFDPAKDSLVRVEMKRLREALGHYYSTTGAEDPVRIEIPKGSYVPEFQRQSAEAAVPKAPPAPRKRMPLLITAVLIAAVALGWALFPAAPFDPGEGEPSVLLTVDPAAPAGAQALIVNTLSRFHNFALVSDGADIGPDSSAAQYHLTLSAPSGADGPLQAALLHLSSGEIIASDLFNAADLGDASAPDALSPFRIWLGRKFARNGAMEADYYRRDLAHGDMACSDLTETYFSNQTDETHSAARDCILARLDAGQNSARLHTDLAFLYREEHSDQRNLLQGDPLDRAAQAARAAIAQNRFDSLAHYALMTVLFASGATEEAKAAGRRAIELNPFDGEAIGGFAARLNYVGEHAEALALFDRSRAFVPGGLKWRDYGYFLAHLGLGDLDRAAEAGLSLRGLSNNALYLAALAISFDHVGEAELARETKSQLLAREPDIRDMFTRRAYAPALVETLVTRLDAI